MNKPFLLLVLLAAVVVAALLAFLRLMGTITDADVIDTGLKTGLLLAIALVAGLLIDMLSKPKA